MLRDSDGKLIFAFYKEFGECDVLSAEGLPLLAGLKLSASNNLNNLFVEVDSVVLVHLIYSDSIGKWPLYVTLHIRSLIPKLSAKVYHVFREVNSVANKLASLRLGSDFTLSQTEELPPVVRACLSLDYMALPFVRKQIVRE